MLAMSRLSVMADEHSRVDLTPAALLRMKRNGFYQGLRWLRMQDIQDRPGFEALRLVRQGPSLVDMSRQDDSRSRSIKCCNALTPAMPPRKEPFGVLNFERCMLIFRIFANNKTSIRG